MPKVETTWRDLLESVASGVLSNKKHNWSSYSLYMVYFLPVMQEKHGWANDVPRFMHMLQHVHRATNHTFSAWHLKSFHDTEKVLTIHHHLTFDCLGGKCSTMYVPKEIAQLNHYRNDCRFTLEKECPYYKSHTVRDDSILRYKATLVNNTLNALRHTGLLNDHQVMLNKTKIST